MQGACLGLAWCILSLAILLATESLASQAPHERRTPLPIKAGASRRKVLQRQTVDPNFSASISGDFATSDNVVLPVASKPNFSDSITFNNPPRITTSYSYSYGTALGSKGCQTSDGSNIQVPSTSTNPTQTPALAPSSSPTSTAASYVSTGQSTIVQVCNKQNVKSEINRMLIECEAKMQARAGPISLLAKGVTAANSKQIATQLGSNLEEVGVHLKSYVSSIQSCGNDPNPLSADRQIAISDVAWSAFQVVLTLKPLFKSIVGLYERFPIIKSTCADPLSKLSTALAALIGACGIQINLFDTRFFPLVAPQLKEFTNMGGDFVAFVGTFES